MFGCTQSMLGPPLILPPSGSSSGIIFILGSVYRQIVVGDLIDCLIGIMLALSIDIAFMRVDRGHEDVVLWRVAVES